MDNYMDHLLVLDETSDKLIRRAADKALALSDIYADRGEGKHIGQRINDRSYGKKRSDHVASLSGSKEDRYSALKTAAKYGKQGQRLMSARIKKFGPSKDFFDSNKQSKINNLRNRINTAARSL